MALPTTVYSGPSWPSHNPPHKLNGAFYSVVVYDDSVSAVPRVLKATDPSASWTAQDTANEVTLYPIGRHGGVTSVSDGGDIIHILCWPDSIQQSQCEYYQFDTSTDTWTVSHEASVSVSGANRWCSIGIRSDGDVIVAHSGATDRVMGGDKERVDYGRREGGTWTFNVALDAAGDIHYGNPNVVLGVNNDEMHFVWQRTILTANDPPIAWADAEGRTLDSSNNLSTTVGGALWNVGDTGASMLGIQHLVSWNDGTDDVVSWFPYNTADKDIFHIVPEDASGDLVVTETAYLDVFTHGTNASPDWSTTTDLYPISHAIDSATGTLWAVFSGGVDPNTSDKDIYYTSSTDDGATWATPTEHLNGVTCDYISATVYTRGSATVLAYLYDDGGTTKYNEHEIAGGATTATGTPSIASPTASGTVGILRKATSTAALAAVTVASTIGLTHPASGAPSLAEVDTTGTAHAAALLTATGSPVLEDLTADGTVKLTRKANGAPAIVEVTTANTTQVTRKATATPSLVPTAVAAAIAHILPASGTPSLADITTTGNAAVGGTQTATGSPNLAEITTANTVAHRLTSSGTPSLVDVDTTGVAVAAKVASGTPTLAELLTANNVEVTRKATATPSIAEITTASTILHRLIATATPSLAEVTTTNTVVVGNTKVASGTPNLAEITTANTVGLTRPATGTPALEPLTTVNNVEHTLIAKGVGGEFTHKNTVQSTGTGTSATITHGISINAGDLVVAYVHANHENSLTANQPGWTNPVNERPDISETCRQGLYWRVAGGSEPATYGWTTGGNQYRIVLKVFSCSGTPTVDLAAVTDYETGAVSVIECLAPVGRSIAAGSLSIVAGGKDNRLASNPITTATDSYVNAVGAFDDQATGMAHRIYTTADTGAQVDLGPSAQADASYSVHITFTLAAGPTLAELTASGNATIGSAINVTGSPQTPSPTVTGTVATNVRPANGTPAIAELTTANTVVHKLLASGTPTLADILTDGLASTNPTAFGTPALAEVLTSSVITHKLIATGTPAIAEVSTTASIAHRLSATGTPAIADVDAAGNVTWISGTKPATGSPQLAEIIMSAVVTHKLPATAAITLDELAVTGQAAVGFIISGNPSLADVLAAGTVKRTFFATGSPSLAPVETANTVNLRHIVTASPSITDVFAVGVVTNFNVKFVMGDITLDEVTTANSIAAIKSVQGAVTIPELGASGATVHRVTASAAVSISHIFTTNTVVGPPPIGGDEDGSNWFREFKYDDLKG